MAQEVLNATGIKWPFQFANGRVAVTSGNEHIQGCVFNVLAINKGEILFRPDFGSDIGRRAFEPLNVAPLLVRDIQLAIARMEPRVEVLEVTVEVQR